ARRALRMALHAQARQLARYGRIRARRSRVPMSEPPHRRQENPRSRSQRMAGPPKQAPCQGQLAIQNRRRPRQAEETVPSVRMIHDSLTTYGLMIRIRRDGLRRESAGDEYSGALTMAIPGTRRRRANTKRAATAQILEVS